MPSQIIEDWGSARRITQTWLKDQGVSASQLAARACVQRSVVSRFLRGQPITPQTAVKLATVIQRSLPASDRISLIAAFGLSSYSELAQPALKTDAELHAGYLPEAAHPDRLEDRYGYLHNVWKGWRLMALAADVSAYSWDRALSILFAAEQAFQSGGPAALAALTAVQVLINLGDLDQAERELVRVEGMYADDMDATTATQAVSMHGWLQFDRGNLPAAQNWFADNLYAAQRRGWASLEGESHHFIALCELGQALMMTDNPRRLSLLRSAEMHMNQSTTCKRRTSESGSIFGFEHFRLSQVLDGQGRHADALIERRKAVALFGDDIAVNHVHIHTADFSLEDGDTAAARRSAHGAMEAWRVMKYAIGMSRAARVLGQADYQEGKPSLALQQIVLASCLDPHGVFGPQRTSVIDFAQQISAELASCQGRRAHRLHLANLREQVVQCSGAFVALDHIAADRTQAIDALFARL